MSEREQQRKIHTLILHCMTAIQDGGECIFSSSLWLSPSLWWPLLTPLALFIVLITISTADWPD